MRILAFLVFSSMCFVACESGTKNSKNDDFHQYYILSKLKDGDTFKIDTTAALERSDSAAFLRGSQEFGRYITELDFGHLGKWVPVSFTVLNENFQDIRASLTPSTLRAIDSLAKIKIAVERNNIYDSLGNIRILDSTRKGLRNHLDSLMR